MSVFDFLLDSSGVGVLFNAVQDAKDAGCNTSVVIPPSIDAGITDVKNNWKPSGLYTVEQVKQLTSFALSVTTQASDAIGQAFGHLQLERHQELLTNAASDLQGIQEKALVFVDALRTASSTGATVIDAPGLKRWIVLMLEAAARTQRTVAVVACARPSFLNVVESLANAIIKLIDFVVAVAGVALDVVKAAGAIVLKIPDLLGSAVKFVKFLPWVALAFGGYYAGIKTGLIPTRADPLKLRERNTFKPWKRAD